MITFLGYRPGMLFIEVPLLGLCRLDHTKKSYREEREVSQFYSINVYLNTLPHHFTSQVTFISLTKNKHGFTTNETKKPWLLLLHGRHKLTMFFLH